MAEALLPEMYDPTDDTIDTIVSGLLPVFIFGLFNGFKNEKKKQISFINIFDDTIIFGSMVGFPIYTGIEWSQYNDNYYKAPSFIILSFGIISIETFVYLMFLFRDGKHKRTTVASCLIIGLSYLSTMGYISILRDKASPYLSGNSISDHCIENYGLSKCKILNTIILVVFTFNGTQVFVVFVYTIIGTIRKNIKDSIKDSVILNFSVSNILGFFKVLRWLGIISMILVPAVVSGYLLSTNPRVTKIAFGICSISIASMVNHFNEEPEEINTVISCYLHGMEINIDQIKSITEKLTKKIENLTSEIKKQMVRVRKLIDEDIEKNEIMILEDELNEQLKNMKVELNNLQQMKKRYQLKSNDRQLPGPDIPFARQPIPDIPFARQRLPDNTYSRTNILPT